jgi:hypothetical protein
MSEGDALQFDQAEFVRPEARTCAACKSAIVDEYYGINGSPFCKRCHDSVQASVKARTTGREFLAALGWGTGAAIVGAAIFYGVRALTGYELALIAIVVGILVGKGVARGARGRGGGGYQLLAMALTYLSIALTFVPYVIKAYGQEAHDGGALASFIAVPIYVALSLAGPFIVGFKSPISIIIYGIGIYEAWKMNKRPKLTFSGPHKMVPAPAPAAPSDGG